MIPRSQNLPLVLGVALATVLLLVACGGEDDLAAASAEVAQIEQEVAEARTAVEEAEAEAATANEVVVAARATLEAAEARLAGAREQVAKQANDAVVFHAVQRRLLDDSDLEGVAISARVQKRIVTLDGSVPNETLKKRAEEVAAGTTGVETVINQITVEVAAE